MVAATPPLFEIITATFIDYAQLLDVWEASVRATHTFITALDIQTYKPLILNEYFDQLELFCIKDQGNITGFIGINGNLIQMLFVRPDVRGTGIGKALIKFAIHHRPVNSVDVNEQNIQAVGFYEQMGFKVIERFDHDAAGKPYPILAMALKTAGVPRS